MVAVAHCVAACRRSYDASQEAQALALLVGVVREKDCCFDSTMVHSQAVVAQATALGKGTAGYLVDFVVAAQETLLANALSLHAMRSLYQAAGWLGRCATEKGVAWADDQTAAQVLSKGQQVAVFLLPLLLA